jgi:hypothetical protein
VASSTELFSVKWRGLSFFRKIHENLFFFKRNARFEGAEKLPYLLGSVLE